MAIRGLTVRLLLALALYNCSVTGDIRMNDCTLPWKGRVNSDREFSQLGEWYKIKYITNNVCPTPIGVAGNIVGDFLGHNIGNLVEKAVGIDIKNQAGEYCCYDLSGNVECCDFSHFLLFGLICLIPLIVIPYFICRICCSCCTKRRQNGRVLGMPTASLVFVEAPPTALSSHQTYYQTIPASTGSTPLIPNEYPTNMKN